MVRRIGDSIRAGELDNTIPNSVHGWLHLWATPHPILLQLTGNGGRGLRGRKLRFRCASAPRESKLLRRALQAQQIGPVQRLRLAPHLDGETKSWRMRLLLDWFSQDGRILAEIWEPSIEFILRPSAPRVAMERAHDAFANLLSVDPKESGERDLFRGTAEDASSAKANGSCDAQYWRMLDDVVSGARDVAMSSLFDPPLRLQPAEQMSDREVSRALRKVLARLARHGVAIDVCPHFSPRQTYRWLLNHILPAEEVFPDLPRLGYVVHYMTSEHCSECTAKAAVD